MSYYNPWDLCSFPVGQPQPYYRCHSGDLYEVFGSYHIFDLPIRTEEDIGHTNLQQDIWGAFARTGNPNPSIEYLRVRGYDGSYAIFDKLQWPQFDGENALNIDYPSPYVSSLPFEEKCAIVEELYQVP